MAAMGDSAWDQATARIVKMIKGEGADHLEFFLPEGYGSGGVVEKHARLFAEANDVDVAMIMPVLLCAWSGATQGAFTAPLYSEDWSSNPVPLVFQFFGIAESGARKSTVIKEGKGPLEQAMKRGVIERRKMCGTLRKKAMTASGQVGIAVDANKAVWEKVYAGGVCASTLADNGTPEGIRNKMVSQGGHRVLMTGESDVMREATGAYSKNGGSLGLFIRGWDQETIAVDRASDTAHLYMPEASLPLLVYVQPNSFALYTTVGQNGYDEWTDKGVFGRAWLWRMPKATIPQGFQFKPKPKVGEVSPLMAARMVTLERMENLVARSNEYRAAKGIRYAWETTAGADTAIEEKYLPPARREALDLDGAAGQAAFVRVQNMMLVLRHALEEADAADPGVSYQYHPLVARFTDHVMRLAALLSLADDPGALAVDTAHIEDVATRLMPWLWSGWVDVMDLRRTVNAEEILSSELMKNPSFTELDPKTYVLRAMAALSADDGPTAMVNGFLGSEITNRARGVIKKPMRSQLGRRLKESLEELAVEGKLVVRISGAGPVSAIGKVADRFKLTAAGHAAVPKKF